MTARPSSSLGLPGLEILGQRHARGQRLQFETPRSSPNRTRARSADAGAWVEGAGLLCEIIARSVSYSPFSGFLFTTWKSLSPDFLCCLRSKPTHRPGARSRPLNFFLFAGKGNLVHFLRFLLKRSSEGLLLSDHQCTLFQGDSRLD